MHESTYGYLQPTPAQIEQMETVRNAAKTYSDVLEEVLPDGPDKTYVLRKLRTVTMWANVALTREANGAPR